MKLFPCLFVPALLLTGARTFAQNVFPTPSGNVGIGTTSPTSKLQVVDNTRNYYVNRGIVGATQDSQGPNYLLLFGIYTGTTLTTDRFVMGKFSAVRGGQGWNRKWSVEVNAAAAYQSNRGSLISYNEPTRLVTLTYNSVQYLALEITNNSSLNGFSFTGYALNDNFQIVADENVTDITPFQPNDPVVVQGLMGVGVLNPAAMHHVHSPTNLSIGKFTQGSVAATDGFVEVANGTAGAGAFYASIRGRSLMPGRTMGVAVIGEANDIVPPAADASFGAIVLDARNKTGARLLNSNVLAVNTGGVNLMLVKADGSVGIGTTNTFGHKLAVNGSGIFTKVKVKAYGAWPDYVFDWDYRLPSLAEAEHYILANKHLEGIPSRQEVNENGIDLGEMDQKLLRKIEELMLYTIAQQKQIDQLLISNKELKEEIEKIKK